MDIKEKLLEQADKEYADFQSKLLPEIPRSSVLGIRVPQVRKIAGEYRGSKVAAAFMEELPHEYYDENMLHAALISEIKNYDECVGRIDRFLPFVDNWAVDDTMNPKVLSKNKDKLLIKIGEWISSDKVYTCRFGIRMLMCHFLDEDFKPEYPERVAAVRSDEYYVNMMIAWYFATALAKQWEATIPFIEMRKLDLWTHNKAIQKARESFRVTDEHKEYLKSLKIKSK